ncbi:MAG: hypothetical protein QM537_06780 [Candidatus Symbiobacter sp.]|nr:hypothetical protein [Candidatus Symbiobacter sp.]
MTVSEIFLSDAMTLFIIVSFIATHFLFRRQSVSQAKEEMGWIKFNLGYYGRIHGITDNPFYRNCDQFVAMIANEVDRLRIYKILFWLARIALVRKNRERFELALVNSAQNSHRINSASEQLTPEQRKEIGQEMTKFLGCLTKLLFLRTPVTIMCEIALVLLVVVGLGIYKIAQKIRPWQLIMTLKDSVENFSAAMGEAMSKKILPQAGLAILLLTVIPLVTSDHRPAAKNVPQFEH